MIQKRPRKSPSESYDRLSTVDSVQLPTRAEHRVQIHIEYVLTKYKRSTAAGGHVRHGRNARPHTTGRCITTQSSTPVRPRTGGEKQTRPDVCPTKNAASPQTRTDRAVYESGY